MPQNNHIRLSRLILFVLTSLIYSTSLPAQNINEAWVQQNYSKREVYVPMRDGIQLYTAIYEPLDKESHPILWQRTPYGCHPYGPNMSSALWKGLAPFCQKKYILVYQDVRGRRMSEGDFLNVRPIHLEKGAPSDDVSDAYDTAEWLIHHTRNNGNIGLTGNSYLGYYALISSICRHPAIKAVCAQAPIGDWFLGDDIHHNGVVMLTDAFRFLTGFNRPRKAPSPADSPYKPYYNQNERDFFLQHGCLGNILSLLGDSISFWTAMAAHPDYDKWWQERSYTPLLKRQEVPTLVVGGLFDAEDLYGTWNAYHHLKNKPNVYLLIGPWAHGAWQNGRANSLGKVNFGDNDLGKTFREAHLDFFNAYLCGNKDDFKQKHSKATVFFTGENRWHNFNQWPAVGTKRRSIYLHSLGQLRDKVPTEKHSFTTYHSDPNDPVPYSSRNGSYRNADYMVEDQRFTNTRKDVINFYSETLTHPLTLGGPIEADIWISTTGSDADLVVKLIDVYPDKNGEMSNYHFPVRFDIMRARYRQSFSHPIAMKPGQPERIRFNLPDVAHTFQAGHKILIQIQSTWFPLAERNPQQFINVWQCRRNDFHPADITIYHQKGMTSRLILPVIDK